MNEIVEFSRETLVNIIAFRTGIVFIALILIRLIIPFYKYNIRMASFYESRRFALKLSGIRDLERVKAFADVLATEKLDFEKEDIKSQDMKDILQNVTK